ncbi:MAG: hypothetical protein U9Q70_01455 [Chloroflexota bacterium]|nr:hypothetical protein [Chloroflexota bacterium]
MTEDFKGKERHFERNTGVAIDGAPISYVVALAAVGAVLAFIPFSMVIGAGKSFPLSQSIYPLVGWVLGPVAGALANGIGAAVGVILAPHTTTIPIISVLGSAAGGLTAGTMLNRDKRNWWWFPLALIYVLIFVYYVGRAVLLNGATWGAVLFGTLIDWSALLLFISPLRGYFARLIGDENPRRLAAGLFCGTWMVAGLDHLIGAAAVYYLVNWPNAAWLAFAPLAPLEHLLRSTIGAVIGTGVIVGLRAIGLLKPSHATY